MWWPCCGGCVQSPPHFCWIGVPEVGQKADGICLPGDRSVLPWVFFHNETVDSGFKDFPGKKGSGAWYVRS